MSYREVDRRVWQVLLSAEWTELSQLEALSQQYDIVVDTLHTVIHDLGVCQVVER